MDAGYDALEQAASSYAKVKDREDDDGRSHRSHRERDRGEHDRDRDRDRDRRHRNDRDDSHRDRDHERPRERPERDDRRDRDRERDGYRERERYDRERERDPRDFRDDRRRRRDDNEFAIAEPMAAHRDRRPRYEEEPFAAPMRGYDHPPPGPPGPPRGRRDDFHGDRGEGGGWRGGGPRRDGGRGGRRGGGSPPRSPTPPGTVPLEERHVENSYWDIRPPQFAGIGAMEAKMTGMFTYGPGRVPPPLHLGVPSSLIAGSFPPSGVIPPARQSKRIYIGGLKDETTTDELKDFFHNLMDEHKLAADMPGEPIAEVQINQEKSFAFLEFRTGEEASAAMQFDGVMFDGIPLRVRRPKDYIGIDPSLGFPGIGGTTGESPNKLFVGGLPTYLNDEQVMELLKSFGELRSFNLVKESAAGGESKGFAFAEYLDSTVTDMAIAGLHNFQLGDRTLVVQRAAVGRNTGIPSAIPGSAAFLTQAMPNILQSTGDAPSSRVMLLLNMVTPEELYVDADYNDIVEDINDECGKYGEVEGVRIPRPVPKSKKWEPSDSAAATIEKNRKADEKAGVGRVYVMYRDIASTAEAMKAIGGRQFAGRTILVASVPEEEFLGPAPPPPPPEDMDAAAAAAVNDIMAGLT